MAWKAEKSYAAATAAGRLHPVEAHHCLIKQGCLCRMGCQPIEYRCAEGFLEPSFPRPDRMQKMIQRARNEFARHHQNNCVAGSAGLQHFPQRL